MATDSGFGRLSHLGETCMPRAEPTRQPQWRLTKDEKGKLAYSTEDSGSFNRLVLCEAETGNAVECEGSQGMLVLEVSIRQGVFVHGDVGWLCHS